MISPATWSRYPSWLSGLLLLLLLLDLLSPPRLLLLSRLLLLLLDFLLTLRLLLRLLLPLLNDLSGLPVLLLVLSLSPSSTSPLPVSSANSSSCAMLVVATEDCYLHVSLSPSDAGGAWSSTGLRLLQRLSRTATATQRLLATSSLTFTFLTLLHWWQMH